MHNLNDSNKKLVYADGVIEVYIIFDLMHENTRDLALRYVKPARYGRDGTELPATNKMGGETDLFVLPYTFALTIGKKLFEQKSTGLNGFSEEGFKKLQDWLVHGEVIDDVMCY